MNRAERRKLAKSVINRRGRTLFARAKRLASKAQRQELTALQRGIVAAAAIAMHVHGQASAKAILATPQVQTIGGGYVHPVVDKQVRDAFEQERRTPGGLILPAGVRA